MDYNEGVPAGVPLDQDPQPLPAGDFLDGEIRPLAEPGDFLVDRHGDPDDADMSEGDTDEDEGGNNGEQQEGGTIDHLLSQRPHEVSVILKAIEAEACKTKLITLIRKLVSSRSIALNDIELDFDDRRAPDRDNAQKDRWSATLVLPGFLGGRLIVPPSDHELAYFTIPENRGMTVTDEDGLTRQETWIGRMPYFKKKVVAQHACCQTAWGVLIGHFGAGNITR